MSDYQQAQSGWEWLQEDEQRCEAEKMDIDRDMAMYEQSGTQLPNDRLLADFDKIFMNEGE